ncbi:MAG: hypothetical protein ACOCXG_01340 [Nanoarchaeota archaeon]
MGFLGLKRGRGKPQDLDGILDKLDSELTNPYDIRKQRRKTTQCSDDEVPPYTSTTEIAVYQAISQRFNLPPAPEQPLGQLENWERETLIKFLKEKPEIGEYALTIVFELEYQTVNQFVKHTSKEIRRLRGPTRRFTNPSYSQQ